MDGIARTFFAVMASLLRLAAWAPLGVGEALMVAEQWCEDRAAAPMEGGR